MHVGRVGEIWRYPVKSMAGERLRETSIGARGLPGDRAWALRDEGAGEIRGARSSSGAGQSPASEASRRSTPRGARQPVGE